VASLPWLRRSALLSKEEAKNLTFEQINQKSQQVLTNIVAAHVDQLDSALPSVLAAHAWVSGAKIGSERLMTIGQEPVLLLSNIAHPVFDYVALGHIHHHQVLSENPPVVYAGSLERVDFSEEKDEKGFYLVEIGPDEGVGKRQVSFAFHPVMGRRFLTINVTIDSEDADPTRTVLEAIKSGGEGGIKDAIVRLQISLPSAVEGQLRGNDIKDALVEAHYFTIAKDIQREARLRLGQFTAEEIKPIDALRKWLETQKFSPERAQLLLEYGERLIREQGPGRGAI